jgi:NADH-quinone oxidoreductase subunit M
MFALLFLVFPLILALVTLVFKGNIAKWIAFGGSLAPLALVIYALFFNSNPEISQFVIEYPWIQSLGISFKLGLDAASLILILLTNILVPLIILSSFNNRPYSENTSFYALILFMQSALVGVFSALDCFLFYIFWEAALIPVYFIAAIWGGEDRVRVTFKFFIYTIFGSLFMLIGIIYLYLLTPAPHSFDWNVLTTVQMDSTQELWVFLAFFLAFAIKMPIFPFHTWQPDTYTVANTCNHAFIGHHAKNGDFRNY